MLRTTRFAAAFLVAASPLAAQEFSDRWEVLGSFTVTAGGTEHILYALEDLETPQDLIVATEIGPLTNLMVMGGTHDGNDSAAPPFIIVSIGPYMGTPGDRANIEWRASETTWFANADSGTPAILSDSAIGEDGSLSFAFYAEMIPMELDEDYAYVPAGGIDPISISGRFEGRLPAGD